MTAFSTLLKKFVTLNSKPTAETFPELPEIIVWLRFVLGLLYGTWLGFGGHDRGGAGVLFGLNFVTFLPILYCTTYLGADSESYGSKIFFSGVINSFALMLLIWIYFYTVQHSDEEAKIADALLMGLTRTVANATLQQGDSNPLIETTPPEVETEF